jgi:hypothetical protein
MGRDVPAKPLVLTKEQGATRQTLAAIEAFFRGDFDVAITLAGAAEGMIERDGPHLRKFMLEHPSVAEFPRKKVNATINAERDWLKHGGPEPVQIQRAAAAFMIVRAASKLDDWPPLIDEFRDWVLENLESLGDG